MKLEENIERNQPGMKAVEAEKPNEICNEIMKKMKISVK
jgi:hypothetical protein